jgi:hypothetical protein
MRMAVVEDVMIPPTFDITFCLLLFEELCYAR